jgi:hypothetical protein
MRWLTILAATFLSGCATTGATSDPACGTVYRYSIEERRQAADEIESLPPGSMLERMTAAHGAQQAENRACRASAN